MFPLIWAHALIRLDPLNTVVHFDSVLLLQKIITMIGELVHYAAALSHGTHDFQRNTGRPRQGRYASNIACLLLGLELNDQPLRVRR